MLLVRSLRVMVSARRVCVLPCGSSRAPAPAQPALARDVVDSVITSKTDSGVGSYSQLSLAVLSIYTVPRIAGHRDQMGSGYGVSIYFLNPCQYKLAGDPILPRCAFLTSATVSYLPLSKARSCFWGFCCRAMPGDRFAGRGLCRRPNILVALPWGQLNFPC